MPVERRPDDDGLCRPDFIYDLKKLVIRKLLAISVNLVLGEIQRLVFFALKKSCRHSGSVSVGIGTAVDKKNAHNLYLPLEFRCFLGC